MLLTIGPLILCIEIAYIKGFLFIKKSWFEKLLLVSLEINLNVQELLKAKKMKNVKWIHIFWFVVQWNKFIV